MVVLSCAIYIGTFSVSDSESAVSIILSGPRLSCFSFHYETDSLNNDACETGQTQARSSCSLHCKSISCLNIYCTRNYTPESCQLKLAAISVQMSATRRGDVFLNLLGLLNSWGQIKSLKDLPTSFSALHTHTFLG